MLSHCKAVMILSLKKNVQEDIIRLVGVGNNDNREDYPMKGWKGWLSHVY